MLQLLVRRQQATGRPVVRGPDRQCKSQGMPCKMPEQSWSASMAAAIVTCMARLATCKSEARRSSPAVMPASQRRPYVTYPAFTTYARFAARFDGNGMPLAAKLLQPEQRGFAPEDSESQRREIMVSLGIQSRVCIRESVERKAWTSEDWREISVFLAQSCGLVCAAIFLYSLGPALGMTLIAVSLAVWLLLRSQIASEEEEDGINEDCGHAAAVNSPSHCANPAWLRNSRMLPLPTARPVVRQGA